jgi:hypothetical protein
MALERSGSLAGMGRKWMAGFDRWPRAGNGKLTTDDRSGPFAPACKATWAIRLDRLLERIGS